MKLAIFDIDGTLTRTNYADKACYLRTIQSLIHPEIGDYEEESFTHFTDSCMVRELWLRWRKKEATADEIATFQSVYFAHLRDIYAESRQHFAPLPAAEDILLRLQAEGWAIALATGCWRESANMKLQFAGVKVPENAPFSTASDGYSRQDIMQNAIRWAADYYLGQDAQHSGDFSKIVYIGDGIWDLRTCASLAIPFVGIDAENDEKRRQKLGAHFLLQDYGNFEQLLACLHQATAPDLSASQF
jgi:phosphoglycolate phosphatase-like HAD superfamily hydrolase